MTKVAAAKAVGLEDELARRGHRLKRQGRELVGPCPVCGGTDRFGVNLAKQVWNCRGCAKGGDVIQLVEHVDGCDFAEAVALLAGDDRPRARNFVDNNKGDVHEVKAKPTQPSRDWWSEARPIAGTLAETYLHNRRITELPPAADDSLRFHPEVVFGQINGAWRYVPCLLALVRDVISNQPIGLQRIGLTADGHKINRMALGKIAGGAVKLWPDEEVTTGLVVGEGVETTLFAATSIEHRATLLRPAWAAVFAGNMTNFPVLPGIEALTLLVDHDLPDQRGRQPGQEAAEQCAQRWLAAGREVHRLMLDQPGSDFNDVVVPCA